jgi:hypothetical protein
MLLFCLILTIHEEKHINCTLDTSKGVGLEVDTEKTKYIFMYHNQYPGQNHNIKVAYKSFKNVAELIVFGSDSTKSKLHHEKLKSRLNSRNTSYHSV